MINLDEIKSIPIVDIYNHYVGGILITRGRQYWARCSWHGSDSEPSLKLYYSSQNSWWCYGCQAGGSQIDMVMKALDLSVTEAIHRIQHDYNIGSNSIPDRKIRKRQINRNINEMFEEEFNRTFVKLGYLNRQLAKLSRDIKTCIRYPEIFMYQLTIDNFLEDMCSGNQADQVTAWRRAKKVFPWI
jgi:DNA primase